MKRPHMTTYKNAIEMRSHNKRVAIIEDGDNFKLIFHRSLGKDANKDTFSAISKVGRFNVLQTEVWVSEDTLNNLTEVLIHRRRKIET